MRIALAIAVAVGAAGLIFAWSGLYSVAASRGHFFFVEWLLDFGMHKSVETHAFWIAAPADLDDAGRRQLGAVHYDLWCASCHGSPADRGSAVTVRMLPPPPPLDDTARKWKPRELFWIVKNGIKYTGMPAWPAPDRADEVWSVVAFLRAMRTLDMHAYQTMVRKPGTADAAAQCTRCHGDGDRPPIAGVVPSLHGQPEAFLAGALERYASGARSSGIMRPIAASLDRHEISAMAAYYAAQPSVRSVPGAAATPDVLMPDVAILAEQGARTAGIPPCLECHGDAALDRYPRLAGQGRDYMIARLRHMQSIAVPVDSLAAIMVPIAKRLTGAQVVALSEFFASRRPASDEARRR